MGRIYSTTDTVSILSCDATIGATDIRASCDKPNSGTCINRGAGARAEPRKNRRI